MDYVVKGEERRLFELDVLIPSRALAFEYNGEYHYQFVPLYLLRWIVSYRQSTAQRVKKRIELPLAIQSFSLHVVQLTSYYYMITCPYIFLLL